ncbi:MAG: periplasmic heavy metal sensor [Hyphomicrobiaceae bacterium]
MSKTTGGTERPGRWLWIVLIASLMANMVVFGAIAGRYWSHGHFGRDHGRWERQGFLDKIAEPRRNELRQMLTADRESLQPLRDEVRKLRAEAREAMSREPFDGTAIRGAIDKVTAARARVRAQMIDDLVEVMGKMTPEERRVFNEHRKSRRDRGKRRDDD